MSERVTALILGFGPEVEFLKRCLDSIQRAWPELLPTCRVGLNAPQPVLQALVAQYPIGALHIDMDNPGKYPMMRRLLYEDGPQTDYVMWFDADSFVKPDITPEHLDGLLDLDEDLIGSAHQIRLAGGQADWIAAQPWARGARFNPHALISFSVGGWWIARRATLAEIDYPWPTLRHRGGDVMLGVAAKLNDFRYFRLPEQACPVAINADWQGRPHWAPRRGRSVGGIEELSIGISRKDLPVYEH